MAGIAFMMMVSSALALQRLPVQSVYSIGSAGDHLENQAGNNYNPKNMVDGNVKTTWALPYRSGEVVLQFNLRKQAVSLSRIVINNGYGKSEKRFRQNSRAKKIGVYVNGYEKKNLVQEQELADVMEQQKISLPETKNVNSIFIRVHSVYPGSVWPDLCISEVMFEGTSSKNDAEVVEPEDWAKAMDGRVDMASSQKIALTSAQVEEMSRNHYVTLTPAQKKMLHKDWDLDKVGLIPSNWYDCSCGMYSIGWIHRDTVFIPAVSMPTQTKTDAPASEDGDDLEMVYGPYSRGLILGLDGQLYKDGNLVSLTDLIATQKSEKAEIKYYPGYECVESGYSIDFPPIEVIGEKTLQKFKKDLIKAGLKFCEMNEE